MTKKTTPAKEPSIIADNTVLKLVISRDQAEAEYLRTLRKTASKIKLEGFRQGKAPVALVEEQVGATKIINAALEKLLPEAYAELIKKEDKHPLTSPELKVIKAERGQAWELEIQIAERPVFELGKYEPVIKKAHKQAVEEVATAEEQLKKTAAEHEKQEAEGGAKHNHAHPSTLTDDQKQDITLRTIFHQLIESIKPAIPELLVKEDVRKQLDQLMQQLDHFKMSVDEYVKRRGITFEQLTGNMAATALASFQVEFILQAIAEDRKMEIAASDIEEYLKEIQSTKAMKDLDPHTIERITFDVQRKKVIKFLLSTNRV